MKRFGVLLSVLMLLLTACSGASTAAVDEEVANAQTEQVATMSASPTEEEVLTYLQWFIPSAVEVYGKVTGLNVETDPSDMFEQEFEGESIRYERVNDPALRSISDVEDLARSVYSKDALSGYRLISAESTDLPRAPYIEREDKLYAMVKDLPEKYEWSCALDKNVEFTYISEEKIVLHADVTLPYEENVVRGRIVLVREDGLWKLDRFDPPSDLFREIAYQLGYPEGILDTPEKADAFAATYAARSNWTKPFDQYIRDYEALRFLQGEPDGEEVIELSLYDWIDGELILSDKLFLDVDQVKEPWAQPKDERGILTLDYEFMLGSQNSAALFAYAVAEKNGEEDIFAVKEDFIGILRSAGKIESTVILDADKLFFIVPKYYGTRIELLDAQGEWIASATDRVICFGNNGSVAKVIVAYEDQRVEFEPRFDKSGVIEGGHLLDYSYPAL